MGSKRNCAVWHTFDLSLPHTIASYVWADPVSRMLPTCTTLYRLLKQNLEFKVFKSKGRSPKERFEPWLQYLRFAHPRVVAQKGALLAAAILKAHIAFLHQWLERAPGHISHMQWVLTSGADVSSTSCQVPTASCQTSFSLCCILGE